MCRFGRFARVMTSLRKLINFRGSDMKKKNKLILYAVLLFLGLAAFILEIFVFQKPDGILGFLICIVSIYLIIGSIIRLCVLSEKFRYGFLEFLDGIFWLP